MKLILARGLDKLTKEDKNELIKLGLTWEIPVGVTKDTFTYTKDRYQNKEWAQKMYQKDGLTWADDAKATMSRSSNGLVVNFPDVIDYHYAEHYTVTVTGSFEENYAFVSHYYKWEENAHNYSFLIKNNDLPGGTDFTVKVTAYDCFDNPSLNTLLAS